VDLPDYRFWWALFVFFGVLAVMVVQRRYGWWRRAKRALEQLPAELRAEQAQRLVIEGWRLVLMTTSIVVMTGLVFAALLGAPPALVLALRVLAVLGVLGVVVLSMRL
jgi:hypothetical protein